MSDFTTGKQQLTIGQILKPGGTETIRGIAGDYWFGPLAPVVPSAPEGYRPRQYAFPPGANLTWTPKADSPISFEVLRNLADSWDLLRLVIETRKDQLARTKFEIRRKPKPGETADQRKKASAEDKTLAKLREFFKHPDGHHPFNLWLKMWFEDMNVIDATALYLQRDMTGKIASIHPLDGATINRMLTQQGFTPPPPNVAYQQVIYGFPAIDLTTDDLLYTMRNERTHKRYGYSRVEQILVTISIALRRQEFQLQYYTSGNMPEAMCFLPSDLPIDKVKEVQDWFDSVMAGDLAKRRRLTFLPGYGSGENAKPNIIFPKEVLLKDEMDDHLAKIVCYAFGVSSSALQKMMNRASAGEANEMAEEEGLEPDIEFCLTVLNSCLDKMGVSDEYEFASPQRREVDVLKAAQSDNLLAGKIYAVNEIRVARGEEPRDEPEADMLGTFTQQGFIPIGVLPEPPDHSNGDDNSDPNDKPPSPKGGGDKGKNKKKVSKFLSREFKVGTLTHSSQDAKSKMVQVINKAFKKMKTLTEDTVVPLLKAAEDEDWFKEFLADIERDFVGLAPELVASFIQATLSGVTQGLLQVHVNDTEMLSEINTVARDWARDRAAELVGMSWDQEGNLVENPSAQWAISDTTRDELRNIVTQAFEDPGFNKEQFITRIEEAGVFSEARAEMIAQTEISRAQAHGNLGVWDLSGMVKTVSWFVSEEENVCPICLDIQAGNPYPIESAPVPIDDSHPRCRCVIAADIIEEAA